MSARLYNAATKASKQPKSNSREKVGDGNDRPGMRKTESFLERRKRLSKWDHLSKGKAADGTKPLPRKGSQESISDNQGSNSSHRSPRSPRSPRTTRQGLPRSSRTPRSRTKSPSTPRSSRSSSPRRDSGSNHPGTTKRRTKRTPIRRMFQSKKGSKIGSTVVAQEATNAVDQTSKSRDGPDLEREQSVRSTETASELLDGIDEDEINQGRGRGDACVKLVEGANGPNGAQAGARDSEIVEASHRIEKSEETSIPEVREDIEEQDEHRGSRVLQEGAKLAEDVVKDGLPGEEAEGGDVGAVTEDVGELSGAPEAVTENSQATGQSSVSSEATSDHKDAQVQKHRESTQTEASLLFVSESGSLREMESSGDADLVDDDGKPQEIGDTARPREPSDWAVRTCGSLLRALRSDMYSINAQFLVPELSEYLNDHSCDEDIAETEFARLCASYGGWGVEDDVLEAAMLVKADESITLFWSKFLRIGPDTTTLFRYLNQGTYFAKLGLVSVQRVHDFLKSLEDGKMYVRTEDDMYTLLNVKHRLEDEGDQELTFPQFVQLIYLEEGNIFLRDLSEARLEEQPGTEPIVLTITSEEGETFQPDLATHENPVNEDAKPVTHVITLGKILQKFDPEMSGDSPKKPMQDWLMGVAMGDLLEEQVETVWHILALLDQHDDDTIHSSEFTEMIGEVDGEIEFLVDHLDRDSMVIASDGEEVEPERVPGPEMQPEMQPEDNQQGPRERSASDDEFDHGDKGFDAPPPPPPSPPQNEEVADYSLPKLRKRDSLGFEVSKDKEEVLYKAFERFEPDADGMVYSSKISTAIMERARRLSDPASLESMFTLLDKVEEASRASDTRQLDFKQFVSVVGNADFIVRAELVK